MRTNNFTIAIVGLGTMGEGITQTIASAGYSVRIFDISENKTKEALKNISKRLKELVDKDKLSSQKRIKILENISPVKNLNDLAHSKLIIESIIEDLISKQNIFCKLESIVSENAIIATNTSSIDLNIISRKLKYPERLVGVHFFNPAPVMKLVEIVSSRKTNPAVAELVSNLSEKWGKIPVNVISSPGFIVNRAARPFYCEALFVLKERAADCETCDAIIRDCGGFNMGPFELMDLIGLDVNYEVTYQIWENYQRHPRFLPSDLQKDLVERGLLGRKSGRGFYSYAEHSEKPRVKNEKERKAPSSIIIEGPDYLPESLIKLLNGSSLKKEIYSGEGYIRLPSNTIIGLSNGKSSVYRSNETGKKFISLDLCLDFEQTKRVALAPSLDCPLSSLEEAVGLFQSFEKKVSVIQDIAGMILTRIVAMLVNESSLIVEENIADADSVNIAMRKGLNYPLGPLEWAEKWGYFFVAQTLDNLFKVYGKRYQKSPWLKQGGNIN